jgi:hypothetical protein
MPDSAIPVQQSATILKFDRIETAGSVLTGSGVEPFWTGYRKTGRSQLTQPTAGLEWFYYNISRESRLLFEYFLDEFEIRLAVLWHKQEIL